MAKVAGTCYVKVDGVQYSLRGNMNIAIGNTQCESVVGLDGYHGTKETPMAGSIEGDFTLTAGLDLNAVESLRDVTVTVELINGSVATLNNANQVNHLVLNADDGKFTAKFEGPSGQWQVQTQTAAERAA
jgi:hypothetical protein